MNILFLYLNKDYLTISFKIGSLDLQSHQEQFQPPIDKVNVSKYPQAYGKLRMSSDRLEVESARWIRQNRIPIHERKCVFCTSLKMNTILF